MFKSTLHTEIEYLKGVGPARGEALKKELGIFTFGDLLYHFPFRYIDRSKIYNIADVRSDAIYVQLKGVITDIEQIGKGRGARITAWLRDPSGSIQLVWFKGLKWVQKYLKSGKVYLVFGKPSRFKSSFNIVHPEFEEISVAAQQKIPLKLQPVYSSTEKLTAKGLDSKAIMKLVRFCLGEVGKSISEILSTDLVGRYKLYPRQKAFFHIHFPENDKQLEQAKFRLKFEELFLLQLHLLQNKQLRQKKNIGIRLPRVGHFFNTFYKDILPFELTGAQKRVMKEIQSDMKSGQQMNRLLQGDVGSGKTIVAFLSLLIAIDNNAQGCMMAPTEILAVQHYNNIKTFANQLGLNCELLTGSTKKADRTRIAETLKDGTLHILIGTHALIEDKVVFKNLGLAIIDEQHRFGVKQRSRLWDKGSDAYPHVLIMSATPIPRTLAMTLYGDLDTSVIDELPPGRKDIITRHYYESSRLKLNGSLKKIIAQGQQVYIVYPLIDESEKMDYQNLMDGFDVLSREFPRPEYQIGIVHGRMKAEDKEIEMQRFKNGELHILVSTTVIEVGVDVPNATVMVIESAERFGLSQLHQLRGRVGRGGKQSYCILMTSYKLSTDARTRMKTMVETNDGFKIAEVDLKLRGPGDISGTMQSGMLQFKIANLASDQKIIQISRNAAIEVLSSDPDLMQNENRQLRKFMKQYEKDHIYWGEIS